MPRRNGCGRKHSYAQACSSSFLLTHSAGRGPASARGAHTRRRRRAQPLLSSKGMRGSGGCASRASAIHHHEAACCGRGSSWGPSPRTGGSEKLPEHQPQPRAALRPTRHGCVTRWRDECLLAQGRRNSTSPTDFHPRAGAAAPSSSVGRARLPCPVYHLASGLSARPSEGTLRASTIPEKPNG